MIFAIFPLVDDCSFNCPWFQTVGEVFEVLEQVLEVSCCFLRVSGDWCADYGLADSALGYGLSA
jgi:hypothetical protein